MMRKFLFVFSMFFLTQAFSSEWKIGKMRGQILLNGTPISKEDILKEGDVIVSGEKSFVKILYGKGNQIVLGPASQIELSKIEEKQKKVNLLKGQLRAILSSKKTKDYKLLIKTKTASMGVRGTDFHVSYNDINKISSSISYEGQVDLKHPETGNISYVKPGHVAATTEDKVNLNTKLSPKQFYALKSNTELRKGERKPKGSSKKKEDEEVKSELLRDSSTFDKDKNLVPVPKSLLGDDFEEIEEEIADGPKPGGFIDLGTGIYIAPPEDSAYDKENGVYIPPKEYGDIDPETGSYIPPFGLVLHPLKGFVLLSEKVEMAIQKTRQFVTDVGTKTYDTTTGLVFGAKDKIVEHTGVVGKTVEKSVTTVVDATTGTGKYVLSKSGFALNAVADQMNNYINNGILKRVSDLKKKTYLRMISMHAKNRFGYETSTRFRDLGYTDQVIKIPSFTNHFSINGSFSKKFGKVFVRPYSSFEKKTYLNDKHMALRGAKNSEFKIGGDIGFQKKLKKGRHLQTYLYFRKGKKSRFSFVKNEHSYYMRTKEFGFSKLLIGNKYLASKFNYQYSSYKFDNSRFGNQHEFKLTEILNLSDKNFANLELLYMSQNEKSSPKYSIKEYEVKLNYFFFARYQKMKLNGWLAKKWSINDRYRGRYGREQVNQFGVALKKTFGKFFNVQFDYSIDDIKSKDYLRDDKSHRFYNEMSFRF